MHGHLKDFRPNVGQIGWLNPYHTRCGDGNTEHEQFIKISQTNVNEMIKNVTKEFWSGLDEHKS